MTESKQIRRSASEVLLALEALVFLTAFRVALAVVPVRRILHAISAGQTPAAVGPPAVPIASSTAAYAKALRVRWAVEAVSRNAPAAFVCFPQTLAGYTMLRLRGVRTTMVYGVARGQDAEARLLAHTWLTLGDRILLGGEGSAAFTPIGYWT